jgi:hypothetical protein
MKKYYKYIPVAIGILAMSCGTAWADDTFSQYSPIPDMTTLLDSLLNRIPIFLGAFAMLALLIAGVQYVFALGDATKIEAAKKNITWTIIGIIASSSIFVLIELALWLVHPTA